MTTEGMSSTLTPSSGPAFIGKGYVLRVSEAIEPFEVSVPPAEMEDLRARLRRTRWPEPATVSDWSQGAPLAYVRDLCQYWADKYDWTARQQHLNSFPQFRTV